MAQKPLLRTLSLAFASASLMTAPLPASAQDDTSASMHVAATTVVESTIFSELTSTRDADLTCFTATPVYSATQGGGAISCVPVAGKLQPTSGAKVEFMRAVDSTYIYRVTPATRPDVRCYLTTSAFSAQSTGSGLSCSLDRK